MADLTRFDFHAKKFYFSENVQAMTASEVGQYLLLLVYAWLGGKDTTLPNDPALLARIARSETVSERVLEMFPVLELEEYGTRRRNETLYGEWLEATGRSMNCSVNGHKGGTSKSDVKITAARDNGKLGGRPASRVLISNPSDETEEPKPNPSQTEPCSSGSVQSNSVQFSPEGLGFCTQEQIKPTGGDWKNLSLRYRNVFGKKAGSEFKKRYYEACEKYTEEVVLECFDSWATQNQRDWCESNGFDRPLNLFFKKLPEEAEDTVELNQALAEEKNAAEEEKRRGDAAQAASIARQNEEVIKQWEVKPETGESIEDFMGEK